MATGSDRHHRTYGSRAGRPDPSSGRRPAVILARGARARLPSEGVRAGRRRARCRHRRRGDPDRRRRAVDPGAEAAIPPGIRRRSAEGAGSGSGARRARVQVRAPLPGGSAALRGHGKGGGCERGGAIGHSPYCRGCHVDGHRTAPSRRPTHVVRRRAGHDGLSGGRCDPAGDSGTGTMPARRPSGHARRPAPGSDPSPPDRAGA